MEMKELIRLKTRLSAEWLTEQTAIFKNARYDQDQQAEDKNAFFIYFKSWIEQDLKKFFDEMEQIIKATDKAIETVPVKVAMDTFFETEEERLRVEFKLAVELAKRMMNEKLISAEWETLIPATTTMNALKTLTVTCVFVKTSDKIKMIRDGKD